MIKKIYTLTLNPSIDYIAEAESITLNSTNKLTAEAFRAGGKGINVAIVLKSLGVRLKCLGLAGGFTGSEIIAQLNNMGLENDFINIKGTSRINIKLKLNEITEINGAGPIVTKDDIAKLANRLNDADMVVLSGSVPRGCDSYTYYNIAKSIDCPFTLDCTGELFLNALKAKPFLVKPNIDELSDIFGINIRDHKTALYCADKLVEMEAENVIVSMGGDGAVFTDGKNKYIFRGIKGNVINTVGAGDSMTAGFIYGLMNHYPPKETFMFACACGTACAFSSDLPLMADIENIYKAISVSQV